VMSKSARYNKSGTSKVRIYAASPHGNCETVGPQAARVPAQRRRHPRQRQRGGGSAPLSRRCRSSMVGNDLKEITGRWLVKGIGGV
jgi:hypothetical protein